ncbi:MAG: hypothetical protein HY321_12460 [Armatimonadetes bacterium]|nr:hypothetical protein [Armatimonadota bacterium]
MTHLAADPRLGLGACCLLLFASPVSGQDADASPAQLLTEAQALARALPLATTGWSETVVCVRVANALQRHGMLAEALALIEETCRRNARQQVEAVRDEATIELCRLLVLLGETGRADELAQTATFRAYFMPARFTMARAALEEMGDARLAESIIRHPSLLQTDEQSQIQGGDPWRRACVRLAVQMGRLDLARQLIAAVSDPFWRSGARADLAVALARAGEAEEALETATEAPDPYMAVIGLGRVAAALPEPLTPALDALRRAAEQVTDAAERDAALGIAVSRLAAASRAEGAAAVAGQIKDPIARLKAECEFLSRDRIASVREGVARCPEADRALLWEVVAIACARRGMAPEALDAAGRIADPWQRCRALGTAARELGDAGGGAGAAKAAEAAAASAEAVEDAGWRVRAHVRVALDAERAGAASLADRQLALARKALERVMDPDLRTGLVTGVAEALAALGRGPALREFAAGVFADPAAARRDSPQKAGSSGWRLAARDRLLPLLAAAGECDLAIAECERALPGYREEFHQPSLRALAHRLAQRGRLAEAKALAAKLPPMWRADAYASLALAQLPPPTRPPDPERAVGISLHGSWSTWIARLERIGVRWDLMPYTAPSVLGAEGLKARYMALGYPGTDDHRLEAGASGSENLRDFLYGGGGLLGICAGANLTQWQRSTECDALYMRGQGPHQVQIRKAHLVSLGLPPVVTIARMNGPILIPRPGCEVLGWYDRIEQYAALVAQDYGYGRAVAFSPHPESASGFDPRGWLYTNALRWVMAGTP